MEFLTQKCIVLGSVFLKTFLMVAINDPTGWQEECFIAFLPPLWITQVVSGDERLWGFFWNILSFTSITEMATRRRQERPRDLPSVGNPDMAQTGKSTWSSSKLILYKGLPWPSWACALGQSRMGKEGERFFTSSRDGSKSVLNPTLLAWSM